MSTANKAWLLSIQETLEKGESIAPRGIKTFELRNQVHSFDMNSCIVNQPERRLSYRFMAAEAYWITSGSCLVEEIEPYNRHIAKFSDDGEIFNGAYGPMFANQLEYIVKTLHQDWSSRQAIMTIWHPNPINSKDHKCTVALGFMIRSGRLHTTVLMRSNDLWLGRPYDMFNFTIMTLKVLTRLNELNMNLELGTQVQHTMSSHIYDSNLNDVMHVMRQPYKDDFLTMPMRCWTDWDYVVESLLDCRDNKETTGLWRIRREISDL